MRCALHLEVCCLYSSTLMGILLSSESSVCHPYVTELALVHIVFSLFLWFTKRKCRPDKIGGFIFFCRVWDVVPFERILRIVLYDGTSDRGVCSLLESLRKTRLAQWCVGYSISVSLPTSRVLKESIAVVVVVKGFVGRKRVELNYLVCRVSVSPEWTGVFSRAPRRQSERRAQTERRKSFSQRVAKMGQTIPRRQGRSARDVNRTRKFPPECHWTDNFFFTISAQLMNLYLIISDAGYTHRSAVGPRGLQRRPLRLYWNEFVSRS